MVRIAISLRALKGDLVNGEDRRCSKVGFSELQSFALRWRSVRTMGYWALLDAEAGEGNGKDNCGVLPLR